MIKKILAGAVLGLSLVGSNASADVYTVEQGDTLGEIATYHNMDLESLIDLNEISNIDLIYVGEVLNVSHTQVEPPVYTPVYEPVFTPEPVVEETPAVEVEPSNWDAKAIIAYRESRGRYDVTNGRFIGKWQMDSYRLNGDYSPANQDRVVEKYVSERYGTWDNALSFHNAHGWY